jgi:hypothetical protein
VAESPLADYPIRAHFCKGFHLRGDPDLGATNEGVTVLWPLVY